MKRQKEKRQEWIKNGHGEYEEIPEEKDFFDVSKKSDNVVCHFYTDGNERCKGRARTWHIVILSCGEADNSSGGRFIWSLLCFSEVLFFSSMN